MNNILSKITLLLVIAITLSGCAHQRFTKNANNHLQQGHYELAIQEFEKALNLKPDNQENQANYQMAREYMDIWLDSVKRAADKAYANNEPGKAMLLYGKLAEMRKDSESLERYQSLSTMLIQQHQLRVSLEFDPMVFGGDFARDIPGLEDVPAGPYDNTVSLQLENYQSKITHEDKVFSRDHLSGTETVTNPEYLNIQDVIHHQRAQVQQAQDEYQRYRKRYRKLEQRRDRAQKAVHQTAKELDELEEGTEAFDITKKALEDKRGNLAELAGKLAKSAPKLNRYDRRYHRAEKELTGLYEQLSLVAPTVQQDVYSKYHYDLGVLTQNTNAELLYSYAGKVQTFPIAFSYSDVEHNAHPTIDLAEKDAVLKSEEQLRNRIDGEARVMAREALVAAVDGHRQSLLIAADQAASPSSRLEYWVAYSLAGDKSSNPEVEANIRRHLHVELGDTGEFSVERLIDLYGDRLAHH